MLLRAVLVRFSAARGFIPLTVWRTQSPTTTRLLSSFADDPTLSNFAIPQRSLQKVVSATDAVNLIQSGDTVSVSGFFGQGAPEAILKALGDRYASTGSPSNLTLFFGVGPGDKDSKGLNHLARRKPENGDESSPPMLKRTIGAHYGQVPEVAQLALDDHVEAWTLPMGSVSRMIRAQATHSPGHITTIGIGTYVDPNFSGGAVNQKAKDSPLHQKLITRLSIDGQDQLMYKALPIQVAIIRGTSADSQGNISIEQESLKCDSLITAAAAKNSGGVVIAQVKRLAANGSIPSRSVAIPGPLVDCVVVVDTADHNTLHPMSYAERYDPALTGEVRSPPYENFDEMRLTTRKVIARRAFYELKPNTVVNIGIGMPEGLAAVSAEEGMLDFVTLTTEPGTFGGIPCSGQNFGPTLNGSAYFELNQMFDFYDGGGLHTAFLGAAEIGRNGDVNVSRMSMDRLTGPGGFIDISQSTKNIIFMVSMTSNGLETVLPGNGTIQVKKEGKIRKFVNNVLEKTFSGDNAVKRGQTVLYVTERAVFRRTASHEVLELIEIAPGIDLQKDVLDQMDFIPEINPNLKTMDSRIFVEHTMNLLSEFFGSLDERVTYHSKDHMAFLDLFGITIKSVDDILWFSNGLRRILDPLVKEKGLINMVVNYDGFDLRKGLEEKYGTEVAAIEKEYYRSVKRYAGHAFKRAKLSRQMDMRDWDPVELFKKFDTNENGLISAEEFRDGMTNLFNINLTPQQIEKYTSTELDQEAFNNAAMMTLTSCNE